MKNLPVRKRPATHILASICLLVAAAGLAAAEKTKDGQALFQNHCAACHGAVTEARVPSQRRLARANPNALLATMTTGVMRVQAQALSDEEKVTLVETLTGKTLASVTLPEKAFCTIRRAPVDARSTVHWQGWGGNDSSGFTPTAQAGIHQDNVDRLSLQWAFAIPGASSVRGVPTLLGDALFLNSSGGGVYALDRHSGCVYWHVNTPASVRGGIAVGRVQQNDDTPHLFFTANDLQTFAVHAATGEVIWRQAISNHTLNSNTGGTLYHDGTVYIPVSSIEVGVAGNPKHACCTSSGGVIALDAANGQVRWRMLTTGRKAILVGQSAGGIDEFAPSGAPVWASPTIDAERGLIYIGTGENYSRPATLTSDAVMALSLDEGEVVWARQGTADDAWHIGCDRMPDRTPCDNPGPDLDFGMAPILTKLRSGQQRLFAGQKSAVVHAYDPDKKGKPVWSTRVGKGGALGGIHWGMATDGKRVYATNSDRPAVITDINPEDKLAPGLYALDAETGNILWSVPTPGKRCTEYKNLNRVRRGGCLAANSAAPVVAGNLVFAGDLNGVLRIHDATNGALLWSYNTDRTFETVNGIPGKGGSIDGPAPVVNGGQVFLSSGYASFGQKPGNVFMALAPADTGARGSNAD